MHTQLHVVCFSISLSAQVRTWTDSTGAFAVEAEFQGFSNRRIVLKKSDGTVVKVPLDRLSAADQAILKELSKIFEV